MSARRRFTGEFKAKVALEALRGDKTIQEIAVRHKVHPNQVSTWKQRAVEGMKEVFTKGAESWGPRGGDPGPAREDRGVDGGAGFFGQRAQVVSREEYTLTLPPPCPTNRDHLTWPVPTSPTLPCPATQRHEPFQTLSFV